MGCWSENCGLSGLEIRPGDKIYYAGMTPSKTYGDQGVYDFLTPPLYGEYDDYGGVKLLEYYKPLKLKEGDTYTKGCAGGAKDLRFIVRAEIYDMLGTLKPDFAPDRETGKYFKTIKEALEKEEKQIVEVLPFIDKQFELLEKFGVEQGRRLYHVLDGISMGGGGRPRLLDSRELLKKYKKDFIPFYRRYHQLTWGAGELRKQITPWYILFSPQHGGDNNLLKMYDLVSGILKKRIAKDKDDYE